MIIDFTEACNEVKRATDGVIETIEQILRNMKEQEDE